MSADRTYADVDGTPDVSVIVPVNERPEPLPGLYREYSEPVRSTGRSYEFVFVIQPWARDLATGLRPLIDAGHPIRVLEVGQTVAESTLLKLGAHHARAPLLLTLPAYHRVRPEALPDLLERVEAGTDLVTARRAPRQDPWFNRFQSRVFHGLVGSLVGGPFLDLACGVRAMRPEVLRDVALYGDNYRFLPLLARREGYTVVEMDAPQHPADARFRLAGPGVYLRRMIDVLGMFFLLRFTEKPLRFFGLVGALASGAGAVLLLLLLVQRIGGQGIADRPVLLLAVLLFVLGVQAIALGLIGEIIVHLQAPHRTTYRVLRTAPEEVDESSGAGTTATSFTAAEEW